MSASRSAFLIHSDSLLLLEERKETLIKNITAQESIKIIRVSCHGSEKIADNLNEYATPDLFASKQLIVITAAEGKWNVNTPKALITFLEGLAQRPHLSIIIALCQFKASQLKTKQFQKLQNHAQFESIKMPQGAALNQWLQVRAKNYGCTLEADSLSMLKQETMGHLLAADQILQKFQLMGVNQITQQQLIQVLTNHAKYTAFDFISACCHGQSQAMTIMNYLKEQKIAATLLLWNLCNTLKQAYTMRYQCHYEGKSTTQTMGHLWKKQQSDYSALLRRLDMHNIADLVTHAFSIDHTIKSAGEDATWYQLELLARAMVTGKTLCLS
jgi:DNA polymerase III delta subunit